MCLGKNYKSTKYIPKYSLESTTALATVLFKVSPILVSLPPKLIRLEICLLL